MKLKNNATSRSLLGVSRLLVRGLCPGILAFSPAAWADTAVFDTPGTTTWEVPANVSSVTIECRGGGGAGGAAIRTSLNIRGGGGAGGSYASTVNFPVSPGQNYSITVGAGGFSTEVGVTNGSVLSVQNGGISKFSSSDQATDFALAVGGAGGLNAVTITGVTAVNQLGGIASSSGSVGNIFFKGGNGADAGGNPSGAGGGGAGSAANGGNGGGGTSGPGGSMGGGNGASGTALNGTANPGNAPSGGGSGAARNGGSVAAPGVSLGGSGGNGSVTLSFAFDIGVTKYAVTSTNSSENVGDSFDVTITAKNNADVTVPDSINIVTMTSPSGDSLMEFDWDSNGTFDDNSGTLVAGVKTIKARNKRAQLATIVASAGAVTTPAPLNITTLAGAFTKLQILVPGETAASGTDTGKTGIPTNRTAAAPFDVTVNAVDALWNIVPSTDFVSLTSSGGVATLPLDSALVDGTINLSVIFNTPGTQTLTASDVTDGSKSPSITPNITVNAIAKTWVGGLDGNKWDTVTLNWIGPSTFSDVEAAIFNDTGSITPAVNIVGTVSPFSVNVNNSASFPYEFSNGTISGTAGGLNKQGAGALTLSNANTYTGATTVSNNGLLRLQNVSALPVSSALILNSGVLGLGAANFTRELGTASGQVNLNGNSSGFAAYGADRTVNLGGASAQVSWGEPSGNFMHSGATIHNTFLLSRADATHTLEFQNPIVLSGTRFFNVPDGGATVDARLSGAITGTSNFSKAGAGTLELTNPGNAYTGTTFLDSGTLKLGAAEVLPSNTVDIKRGGSTDTNPILDLNGFSETIGGLSLATANTSGSPSNGGQQVSIVNSAGGSATLTVSGTVTYRAGSAGFENGQASISCNLNAGTATRTFNIGDGSSEVDLVISGELTGQGITKSGLGTQSVTIPKYSGNTTVNAGTLILSLANANNDTSTITVATDAVLNLAYSGTDTVTRLVIEGVTQLDGVYGAAQFPGRIAGTGTITVVSDPYIAWASPGVLFDADANNDGVQNGLAWLLGAANPNANANGLLPLVTETGGGLKMTFSMLNAASRGAAVLEVQHSSDLGISDPWTGVVVPGISDGPTNGVTFVIDPGSPLNGVQATISSSEAAGGKVFGRLKAIR